jgi:hypothetical protein
MRATVDSRLPRPALPPDTKIAQKTIQPDGKIHAIHAGK